MIVVIADDITGAAELGAIGMRYGLHVLIAEDVRPAASTELLVIYTNARSMKKAEAVKQMKELTAKAKALNPSLIYKKTDSVLRGHVLAEMQAQMSVLGLKKGLLVPVNPSLGRTIKDGQYFVNGQLVHETSFSTDPEFPVRYSRIERMLGEAAVPVNVIAKEASVVDGIAVGEAQTAEDLAQWADGRKDNVFYAGGASFFDALLRTMHKPRENFQSKNSKLSSPMLFVSGTTFQENKDKIKRLAQLVCYMPEVIFKEASPSKKAYEDWCGAIVSTLVENGKAIIAIDETGGNADATDLREKTSEVVQQVFAQTPVHELLIEGGSTAFSVIQKLGLQSFVPDKEWALGVVRMKAAEKENLYLTIKPGSYDWPAEWDFEKNDD